MYEVNEASSLVVDLELSKRNVEEFIKRYKNNDNYISIKMFMRSILSKGKHDSSIVKGVDWNIEKPVPFSSMWKA